MKPVLVDWLELGRMEYADAYQLQLRLSQQLKSHHLAGYLLVTEHPPTITLGYSLRGDEGKSYLRVSEETIKRMGIKIFQSERGGKATYHGPGQLIVYPVFNLNFLNLSTKKYVMRLEEVVVNWLRGLGIDAGLDLEYPGVWVDDKKIASVGVRIEDRITRHGIAINLNPDLAHFELIIPCGIKTRKMTSYWELTGTRLERKEAILGLVESFKKVFQIEVIAGDKNSLFFKGGFNDNQGMAHAGSV